MCRDKFIVQFKYILSRCWKIYIYNIRKYELKERKYQKDQNFMLYNIKGLNILKENKSNNVVVVIRVVLVEQYLFNIC